MLVVSISKELELLVGLFRLGHAHEEENSFAKEIQDNRKGEV